jgi:hypothetical protein
MDISPVDMWKPVPIFKRYGWMVFFLLMLWVLPSLVADSTPPAEEKILQKEIDLADWGFENVSDVGFLSVGIYHHDTGDELVVYHARKEKPDIDLPSKPQSWIPPQHEGVFLLDDFQEGNTNRLGGYFSRIIRAPSDSHVTIDYAPGGRRSLTFSFSHKSPGVAGFWIHLFDFKLPPVERIFMDTTPFRFLTFDILGQTGEERLSLQTADYTWERKEDSLKIGNVGQFLPSGKIQRSWQRAWVPLEMLPNRVNRKELANLVFLALPGKGKVYIGNIAFTEGKDVPLPKPAAKEDYKASVNRGMWLWNTKDLLGEEQEQSRLIEFCSQAGVTEIFLQLPYDVVEKEGKKEISWDRPKVASLLSRLHRAGIKSHALDGAPHFALREWHGHVLDTIRSIIRYNRSVEPEERFVGIRYDNEPYILPQFPGIGKKSILEQYMELLRLSKDLTASARLEFGVDIPFWFDQKNEFFEPIAALEGRPLTEHILDVVDNIGIMDYRTAAYGADGVIVHALGELSYAAEKGKKVFIGLETVALPDETLLEFGRGRGPSCLCLKRLEGTKILLRWVPAGRQNEIEHDTALFQQKKTFIPSGKITFAERSVQELNGIMTKAESEFQSYPSFYGFAIHYYRSYQKLWNRSR